MVSLRSEVDQSAGDGSAADDTTCNFFLYNECQPILVFRVFSAVPDLVSLIRGSFSKICSADLDKAQDVPSKAFYLTGELLYFSSIFCWYSMFNIFRLSSAIGG